MIWNLSFHLKAKLHIALFDISNQYDDYIDISQIIAAFKKV